MKEIKYVGLRPEIGDKVIYNKGCKSVRLRGGAHGDAFFAGLVQGVCPEAGTVLICEPGEIGICKPPDDFHEF